MTDRPDSGPANGTSPPPQGGVAPRSTGAEDSRAEQVLSQALRVMAGGGKPRNDPSDEPTARRRFTTGQLILLAAIVGLLVGIAGGFLSLML